MMPFLLAPLREGRLHPTAQSGCSAHFYSRPYARGNRSRALRKESVLLISTHAPTRGATALRSLVSLEFTISTRAPTRGATLSRLARTAAAANFYSHPYARGDIFRDRNGASALLFLLTPLREGRPATEPTIVTMPSYFYSRPYARGDFSAAPQNPGFRSDFYSRPYARGDTFAKTYERVEEYFYSRPYVRGD